MQPLIQSQTLALMFENKKVISSHTSAGMLSIIHAGLILMSKTALFMQGTKNCIPTGALRLSPLVTSLCDRCLL